MVGEGRTEETLYRTPRRVLRKNGIRLKVMKKPNEAPARMSRTKSLIPNTKVGATTFGRMCRNMIRASR